MFTLCEFSLCAIFQQNQTSHKVRATCTTTTTATMTTSTTTTTMFKNEEFGLKSCDEHEDDVVKWLKCEKSRKKIDWENDLESRRKVFFWVLGIVGFIIAFCIVLAICSKICDKKSICIIHLKCMVCLKTREDCQRGRRYYWLWEKKCENQTFYSMSCSCLINHSPFYCFIVFLCDNFLKLLNISVVDNKKNWNWNFWEPNLFHSKLLIINDV